MTQISPALSGPTTELPQADADAAGETGHPCADMPQADTASPDHAGNGGRPMSGFSMYDLHPSVQQFAYPSRGDGGDARMLLAHNTQQPAAGSTTQLFGGQQVPGGAPVQLASAPPPAVPAPPIDLRRMEAMNQAVQRFDKPGKLISEAEMQDTKAAFQAATDALRKGDFKTAEKELAKIGFPLPTEAGGEASDEAIVTARMLGMPLDKKGQLQISWGSHGNQAVNDLNGFAANARMINRMASAPGGVSNPPTQAQTMQFMRDFANPGTAKPAPSAQEVMQAASEITEGTIVHYSSAGAKDPVYGRNPETRAFYRDRSGEVHKFDSIADAKAAADAGDPPKAPGTKITKLDARSPDEWSDITSKGTRSGRYVGDCESKLYLQTRLLTEAGFTSLGSVDVRPPSGIGHMLGVFKAPDGSVWVTSNEQFQQVNGSGPKGAVTQADVDATVRDMTADTYHIPEKGGVRDTSKFKFFSAATVNESGPHAATDTIRRAAELGIIRQGSDTLIPPPKTTP